MRDEVTTQEILEYLRDNIVTKEDAESFATKEDLVEFRSEIVSHIDSFVKLHQTLDLELVALRSRRDRLEGRLAIVEDKMA